MDKTKYPCTSAGCYLKFPSAKELRRHKIHAADHEYCHHCDLDFEDFEAHLEHQIEWDEAYPEDTNHIVCRICSIEFKGRDARDQHIKQVILSVRHFARS